MPTPRILILRAPGTNCDGETAFAFEQAGGRADRVHINRLLENPQLLEDYQILCVPGGFSYGDDIAGGRILANQIRHHLADPFARFKDAGKLILGICNGFQVLLKSGVLIADDLDGSPVATFAPNDLGRFETRWTHLIAAPGHHCVFLTGIDRLYLPIANAEGKFVARDAHVLDQLAQRGQLVLRYTTPEGPLTDQPLRFPDNPNGSQANVAGVTDPTGRVLGIMPHPERHIHHTQHPRWTRGEGQEPGDGLALFRNAVGYFSS